MIGALDERRKGPVSLGTMPKTTATPAAIGKGSFQACTTKDKILPAASQPEQLHFGTSIPWQALFHVQQGCWKRETCLEDWLDKILSHGRALALMGAQGKCIHADSCWPFSFSMTIVVANY